METVGGTKSGFSSAQAVRLDDGKSFFSAAHTYVASVGKSLRTLAHVPTEGAGNKPETVSQVCRLCACAQIDGNTSNAVPSTLGRDAVRLRRSNLDGVSVDSEKGGAVGDEVFVADRSCRHAADVPAQDARTAVGRKAQIAGQEACYVVKVLVGNRRDIVAIFISGQGEDAQRIACRRRRVGWSERVLDIHNVQAVLVDAIDDDGRTGGSEKIAVNVNGYRRR